MANNLSIKSGSTGNIMRAVAFNDDGSIKSDLAFDTPGISIFIQRIGEADGTPLTLSAKASPGAAHSAGAFLNLGRGDFSVDCPDAPFATYNGQIRLNGTFTGGYIVGIWFDVVGFDTSLPAVGANTVTPLSTAQTRQAVEDEIVAANLVTNDDLIDSSEMTATRNVDDLTPIRFAWPTDDATITVERSINSGAFEVATGTVSFFRTEGTDNWYILSYNAADRALGFVRYKLTDGVRTRYVSLQVKPKGGLSEVETRGAVGLATANIDTQLAGINNKTSNLPNNPAAVDDVQVTINPTELGSGSVDAIRNGLATETKQDETIDLIKAGELDQDVKVV